MNRKKPITVELQDIVEDINEDVESYRKENMRSSAKPLVLNRPKDISVPAELDKTKAPQDSYTVKNDADNADIFMTPREDGNDTSPIRIISLKNHLNNYT